MNWREALVEAERSSRADRCTSFVNAICVPNDRRCRTSYSAPQIASEPQPYVARYEVSDWFVEGSTVARFDNGVRRELA